MKSTLALLLLLIPPRINAQTILKLERQTSKNGPSRLCVSEFAGTAAAECFDLDSIVPVELNCRTALARFTKMRVTEAGRVGTSKNGRFIVTIDWEAESGGPLAFAGPKGQTSAIGEIKDSRVLVTRFVDGSFSQTFDRSVVFDRSDPAELDRLTLSWLNEVLTPFIQAYFRDQVTLPPKD